MSNLLIKSLNLGFFDSIINWFIGLLTDLLMLIVNWTIDLLITIFAEFLYSIGLTLLSIVDFFQAFFNALCGIGQYYDLTMSTTAIEGDPVFSLITNQSVLQVFLALTVVAVIMLVLTTIIAMIRTEYTTEGAKNTKGNIIGQALKSLAMFFLVPAFCVFGIVLSSALLKTVYNATTGGDNVTAGAMVWYASSYNANKVRQEGQSFVDGNKDLFVDFNVANSNTADKTEQIAIAVDNAFKNRVPVGNGPKAGTEGYTFTEMMTGSSYDSTVRYSYRNVIMTTKYYTLRNMNFIVMFLGGGMAIYIMFIAAFGMIIRLYKCAILFIVSAPITALTPLDGGAAFKNWRKLMIGSVCSAFAVVIAFNLVFLLIPVFNNINIFNPNMLTANYWNRLVNLIFVLSGLYSIKETSKWVANMLGIEDPLAAGSELAGKVMSTVGTIASVAGTAGVGMVGAVAKAGLSGAANAAAANGKEGLAMKLQKGANKFGSFSSAATGKMKGIVGKKWTKATTRLDDFMGGTELIGGQGKDGAVGLAGLVGKGSSKLFDKTAGLAQRAITGAVDGPAQVHRQRKARQAVADAELNLETARNDALDDIDNKTGSHLRQDKIDAYTTLNDPNASEADKTAAQATIDRVNKRAGKRKAVRTAEQELATAQADLKDTLAHPANAQALLARHDADEARSSVIANAVNANDNAIDEAVDRMAQLMATYSKNGDGSGGLNELGMKKAQEEFAKIAEKFGMDLGKAIEDLSTNGGQKLKQQNHEIKTEIQAAQNAGINVGSLNLKAELQAKGLDGLADKLTQNLTSLLAGEGYAGGDLDAKMKAVTAKLEAEQQKVADEIKKESAKIQQLAVAIAKMGKRLNPPKK